MENPNEKPKWIKGTVKENHGPTSYRNQVGANICRYVDQLFMVNEVPSKQDTEYLDCETDRSGSALHTVKLHFRVPRDFSFHWPHWITNRRWKNNNTISYSISATTRSIGSKYQIRKEEAIMYWLSALFYLLFVYLYTLYTCY